MFDFVVAFVDAAAKVNRYFGKCRDDNDINVFRRRSDKEHGSQSFGSVDFELLMAHHIAEPIIRRIDSSAIVATALCQSLNFHNKLDIRKHEHVCSFLLAEACRLIIKGTAVRKHTFDPDANYTFFVPSTRRPLGISSRRQGRSSYRSHPYFPARLTAFSRHFSSLGFE